MRKRKWLHWYLFIFVFLFGLFLQADLHAFTLRVMVSEGLEVTAYRWLLEEDATHHVIPDNPSTNWAIDASRHAHIANGKHHHDLTNIHLECGPRYHLVSPLGQRLHREQNCAMVYGC